MNYSKIMIFQRTFATASVLFLRERKEPQWRPQLVAEMCSCFMGVELDAEASPEHIENHKAYVQSWVQEIRDKPDSLIRAIKDAQAAANYRDMMAGVIGKDEYEKVSESVMEVEIGKKMNAVWTNYERRETN